MLISEAVTVPSLMMRTTIVSKESHARDTHARTHAHTHTHTHAHTHTHTHTHTRTRAHAHTHTHEHTNGQTRVVYVKICKGALFITSS